MKSVFYKFKINRRNFLDAKRQVNKYLYFWKFLFVSFDRKTFVTLLTEKAKKLTKL